MTRTEQRPTEYLFRHDGPMNTVIEVRVEPGSVAEPDLGDASDGSEGAAEVAETIDRLILDEVSRLESVFSAFDGRAELSRWRIGDVATPGPELAGLLSSALDWQARTAGRFNPAAGELTALWQQAEATGREPDDNVVAAAAEAIREPRYRLVDGVPTATADCSLVNLNALAKGHIVDLAVEAALARFAPASLVVSAGGDLRVAGAGPGGAARCPRRIGVENPLRPYDNEPPLTVIEIGSGAVAGSGGARRGFQVGQRRFGHLVDPRSGRPAEGPASVTVVADDTATADVVATAAGVCWPGEALELVAGIPDVAILVVARSGEIVVDPRWVERFGRPRVDRAPGRLRPPPATGPG